MANGEFLSDSALIKGLIITIIISILWIGLWGWAWGFGEIISSLNLKLIFFLGLPMWIYLWYFWIRYNWIPPKDK
jgi:hypothetical protein